MNTWNHWQLNCLINSLIRLTTKETPKLRINGIHEGNQLVTSGFTSQRARNAENISVQTVISVFYICHCSVSCSIMLQIFNNVHTVRRRYSAVDFLTNIYKRHPIARPLGRVMGCLLWIQHLIDILCKIFYLSYYIGLRYNCTGQCYGSTRL